MKSLPPIAALAALPALALIPIAPAFGQRQPPPSPEQRIERLERQLNQVQRQVFPRGRPADTAGFSDEPAAAQSSVVALDQRLDALERQMSDILRQAEENGNQLRTLQSEISRARADQEQRLGVIEQRINDAAAAAAGGPQVPVPVVTQPNTGRPTTSQRPVVTRPGTSTPTTTAGSAGTAPLADPAEDAYTEGFKLWESGQYDAAITSLRAFTSAYPKHRRASFANNLVGRALLDKGQPRAAAEALLANYRSNPRGERAADSLFYLGQALTQLGQPAQACKAYSELDAVYGSKVRADLRAQVDQAKASAQCS